MKLPDIHVHVHTHYPDLEKFMATVAEALAKFKADNDAHNAAIKADLDTIKSQLTDQAAQIATLQQSRDQMTPENQAVLDSISQSNADIQAQADATAGKTPPAPPADNPPAQ